MQNKEVTIIEQLDDTTTIIEINDLGGITVEGTQGPAGQDGADGQNGSDGQSAYDIAVENGFVGTEAVWLASLKGETGEQGPQGTQGQTGQPGAQGPTGIGIPFGGEEGQVLRKVDNVNFNTEWMTLPEPQPHYSLIDGFDAAGDPAGMGVDRVAFSDDFIVAYNAPIDDDSVATVTLRNPNGGGGGGSGENGKSAYEIAVDNGFAGDEAAWLASLHGEDGQDGADGAQGAKGDKGDTGDAGAAGSNGQGVPTGGTTGQVLIKVDGTDFNTAWQTPSGGGGSSQPWYFNPPLASQFTLLSGDATNLTIADDTDVGLMVNSGPNTTAGDISRIAYRTLSNKALDWDLVVHAPILMNDANYTKAGFILMDSVSGKLIICGQNNEYAPFGVIFFNSLTSYGGGLDMQAFRSQPTFYRASSVGSTLTFYVSHDGKNWLQVGSTGVTDFLDNRADRIGFGYNINNSGTLQSIMTIDCFNLTGPAV
ncbi:hypothetical protein [Sphingobium chungangianum]